jgi:hypothetical protein
MILLIQEHPTIDEEAKTATIANMARDRFLLLRIFLNMAFLLSPENLVPLFFDPFERE